MFGYCFGLLDCFVSSLYRRWLGIEFVVLVAVLLRVVLMVMVLR